MSTQRRPVPPHAKEPIETAMRAMMGIKAQMQSVADVAAAVASSDSATADDAWRVVSHALACAATAAQLAATAQRELEDIEGVEALRDAAGLRLVESAELSRPMRRRAAR